MSTENEEWREDSPRVRIRTPAVMVTEVLTEKADTVVLHYNREGGDRPYRPRF